MEHTTILVYYLLTPTSKLALSGAHNNPEVYMLLSNTPGLLCAPLIASLEVGVIK
jgi:hypothetical protein